MRIHSEPGSAPPEHLNITADQPDLGFVQAKEMAKRAARQRSPNAMLLSWNDRKRGVCYPKFECGSRQRPAWILFAESRGGNLTIDINGGEYTFIFLMM